MCLSLGPPCGGQSDRFPFSYAFSGKGYIFPPSPRLTPLVAHSPLVVLRFYFCSLTFRSLPPILACEFSLQSLSC
jgi:hypothetical protein